MPCYLFFVKHYTFNILCCFDIQINYCCYCCCFAGDCTVTWSILISIFMVFDRMYSVIDQLRCSDTDTDDSGDGDNGHFDLNVNASIQRWVPFFIFFCLLFSYKCYKERKNNECSIKKRAQLLFVKPSLVILSVWVLCFRS